MSGLPDRRRNLGPTDTVSFEAGFSQEVSQEFSNTPRQVFVNQGVSKNANGSAYIEVGATRIQCTIHGPQPLRGEFRSEAQVIVTVKAEPFSGIKHSEEMEQVMADFIKTSLTPAILLEEYPKSAITIHLSIISGKDAISTHLAAGVNVATLALVNAGIAMHDMVTASAVCMKENNIYVDADVENDTTQLAAAFFTATKGQIAGFELTGTGAVSRQELRAMLEKAEETAITLRRLFNGYIVEDYAASNTKVSK